MGTSPEAQAASMIAKLASTTGKALEQWVELVRTSGMARHGQAVTWLKEQHGMTHGYANLVAHYAFKSDAASMLAGGADLAGDMFAGGKDALRPIHDALLAAVRGFGADVEEAPKKGYLSLRRSTQFATLHPSTKARFDVGLKLKGVAAAGRLEPAGSWNAMVTHRVRLATVAEVDTEVVRWLRQAYEQA